MKYFSSLLLQLTVSTPSFRGKRGIVLCKVFKRYEISLYYYFYYKSHFLIHNKKYLSLRDIEEGNRSETTTPLTWGIVQAYEEWKNSTMCANEKETGNSLKTWSSLSTHATLKNKKVIKPLQENVVVFLVPC